MDVVMVIFHTYGSAISSPKHNAAVNVSCCSSEVAAICTHDFMHNEHAGVCTALVYYIRKVLCSLLCCGERAKCLLDWADVVVDCLGQTNHCKVRGVVLEIDCKFSTYCVSANGVQHIDPILHKLISGHLLWILPLLHQTTLHAILHIGKLHSAVANRTSSMQIQVSATDSRFTGDVNTVSQKQALVTTNVTDDFHIRQHISVARDQCTDARRETRCKASSSEHGDLPRTRLASGSILAHSTNAPDQ
mmetsp:Transcript_37808/g.68860  ORF Transcript_37808/g.68860 Transcript_37808/m.68860 type:complete len:247 (-) Transcript_37808:146-886(-)